MQAVHAVVPPADAYFLGLDLGQAMDYSALAAIRRTTPPASPRPPAADFAAMRVVRPTVQPANRYTILGLRRWPLGTLYTQIVADVADLVSKPPLSGCVLGVDWTGVGRPIVDMLRAAKLKATLRPILITAGHAVSIEGASFHVPKRELVASLQVLLQSRRLEVPNKLPERATLEKELLAFRTKITAAGNEQFEADWRERAHDDMVLAVAIGCWLGERLIPQGDDRPAVWKPPEQSVHPMWEP